MRQEKARQSVGVYVPDSITGAEVELLVVLAILGLLAGLVWLTKLTAPLFEVFEQTVSWRDIILMGGGLFLLTREQPARIRTLEIGLRRRGADVRRQLFGGRRRLPLLPVLIFPAQVQDRAFGRVPSHTGRRSPPAGGLPR